MHAYILVSVNPKYHVRDEILVPFVYVLFYVIICNTMFWAISVAFYKKIARWQELRDQFGTKKIVFFILQDRLICIFLWKRKQCLDKNIVTIDYQIYL